MSNRSTSEDHLFRVFFQTVEYFSLLLVVLLWILLFTGSGWGDKFHFDYLFDVSTPVMVIVVVSGLLTWRHYRKHAIVHFVVLFAWGVRVTLPRL